MSKSHIKFQNDILLILVGFFLLFVSATQIFAQKNTSQFNQQNTIRQAQEQEEMIRNLSREQKLSTLFQIGTEAYEKSLYEEAEQSFLRALEVSPQNTAILTNLGLVKYQKKENGHAVALWRKALVIDPHFQPAHQALSYSLQHLSPLPSSSIHSGWEKFRLFFLVQVPFSFYMSGCLVAFFMAILFLIPYWKQKYASKRYYLNPPIFPWKIPIFLFIALMGFAFASMKTLDQMQTRATVIEERVPVYLAPSLQQPELFFLFAGGEVLVKKNAESWVQVQSSQGMTGWVPRKFLFYTSGSSIW